MAVNFCVKCGKAIKEGQELCWFCKNEDKIEKKDVSERVIDYTGASYSRCDYISDAIGGNLQCPDGASMMYNGKWYCRAHWRILQYGGSAQDGEKETRKKIEAKAFGKKIMGMCATCREAITDAMNGGRRFDELQNMNCPFCSDKLYLLYPNFDEIKKKEREKNEAK